MPKRRKHSRPEYPRVAAASERAADAGADEEARRSSVLAASTEEPATLVADGPRRGGHGSLHESASVLRGAVARAVRARGCQENREIARELGRRSRALEEAAALQDLDDSRDLDDEPVI